MNLVIVESPAKSKTIRKYLGKDYEVMASYGHIRDLVPKTGAVNPDDSFKMQYETIKKSVQQVNKIIAAFKKSDNLYLATDPARPAGSNFTAVKPSSTYSAARLAARSGLV